MAYGSDFLTGGTASASSIYGAGFEASNAINDTLGNSRWLTAVNQNTGWWKVDLGDGNAKKGNKFRYLGYLDNQQLKDIVLAGSNDDSAYTTLLTQTLSAGQSWQEYTFANSVSYRYYKITWSSIITLNQYGGALEMEMMEELDSGRFMSTNKGWL